MASRAAGRRYLLIVSSIWLLLQLALYKEAQSATGATGPMTAEATACGFTLGQNTYTVQ